MNPIALLGWWKEILIALLCVVIGVQSYRLQGAQGERDILVLEKVERARRDAMREVAAVKNKERTDAQLALDRKRAALVVVRGELDGPGIRAGKGIEFAPRGDATAECFDRGRLNAELAGWMERSAARLTGAAAASARRGDERFTAVAREGEELASAYRGCRAWAVNQ